MNQWDTSKFIECLKLIFTKRLRRNSRQRFKYCTTMASKLECFDCFSIITPNFINKFTCNTFNSFNNVFDFGPGTSVFTDGPLYFSGGKLLKFRKAENKKNKKNIDFTQTIIIFDERFTYEIYNKFDLSKI